MSNSQLSTPSFIIRTYPPDGSQAGYGYPDQKANQMTDKKLGWFDRWFLKKSMEAWYYKQEQDMRKPIGGPSINREPRLNTRNSIDLQLMRADSGWIVQFQRYDSRNDETTVHHHIIPDTEDFGQRLSEIITVETIRGL